MTDDELEALTAAWRTRWGGDPIAHELRDRHADRWVRFHSLPQSKRYAETEDEYEIILERHHQVLTELGSGGGLYLVAGYFDDTGTGISPDPRHPGAVPWLTIEPDDRSVFEIPLRLYVGRVSHDRRILDPLLRGVADAEIGYTIIAPLDLRWLYHPYDGGADCIAPTADGRDVLKARHAGWLSSHPAGL